MRAKEFERFKKRSIHLLRFSGLPPSLIYAIEEIFERLFYTFPREDDYRVYENDYGYTYRKLKDSEERDFFVNEQEANDSAVQDYANDKQDFLDALSEQIFQAALPKLERLVRAVQTNPSIPKNMRWEARKRLQNRIHQILVSNNNEIALDKEGVHSVEDQFMLLFQYISEAKLPEREELYIAGEERIVRRLYGPEEKMDMNADT